MSQLAGYLEILETNSRLKNLKRITIVDRNIERVRRLRSVLDQNFANNLTLKCQVQPRSSADFAVKE